MLTVKARARLVAPEHVVEVVLERRPRYWAEIADIVVPPLAVAAPSPAVPAVPSVTKPDYTVPEGDCAQLTAFMRRLSAFQPRTPEEDIEHRRRLRPALQRAAEAVLKQEKDRTSDAFRAAELETRSVSEASSLTLRVAVDLRPCQDAKRPPFGLLLATSDMQR